MSAPENGSRMTVRVSAPTTWVRILLGIILIVAGLVILGDMTLAAFISSRLIGAVAIAAGGFEIIYALWTKGSGGFIRQLVLGALYVTVGIVLWSQPVAG